MYNIIEFLKRMKEDTNPHPIEKMNELVNYLTQNVDRTCSSSMSQILYAAKKSLYESIIQNHTATRSKLNSKEIVSSYEANDADGNTITVTKEEGSKKVAMFLKSPEVYTKQLLNEYIAKQDELEKSGKRSKEYCEAERNKARSVLSELNEANPTYEEYVFNKEDAINDGLNLISYLRKDQSFRTSPRPVADAVSVCKPGFFEKLFRTTSNQYKNFERLLDERMRANASREDMEAAAKAYLMHKFPNYKGDDELPNPELIERLGTKSRNRAILCYDVLLGINKSRALETKQVMVNQAVDKVIKETNAEQELEQIKTNTYVEKNKVIVDEQIDLQEKLKNEVEENINIIKTENNNDNEKDINLDSNENDIIKNDI